MPKKLNRDLGDEEKKEASELDEQVFRTNLEDYYYPTDDVHLKEKNSAPKRKQFLNSVIKILMDKAQSNLVLKRGIEERLITGKGASNLKGDPDLYTAIKDAHIEAYKGVGRHDH